MKQILMAAVLLLLMPAIAMADGGVTNSGATAASTSNNAATSGATNQGIQLLNNFNSTTPSDQTLRNTPGVVLGGFAGSFSTDYCGGTVQAGASGPGVAVVFGGPKIDKACVDLRTYERIMQGAAFISKVNPQEALKLSQAGFDLLCQISDESGQALSQQGLCTKESDVNPSITSKPTSIGEVDQSTLTAAQYAARKKADYWGTDKTIMARYGLTK